MNKLTSLIISIAKDRQEALAWQSLFEKRQLIEELEKLENPDIFIVALIKMTREEVAEITRKLQYNII